MSGTPSHAIRKRGRPTAEEREQRRDQILDAAVGLFVAAGYGQVTMDEIADASRVTKRTIYSYFGDKAEVFTAAIERFRVRALDDIDSHDGQLEDVATQLVRVLHSDDAVGLHRLMIGEAPQFPELAARFYDSGPRGYVELLAKRLSDQTPPHRRRDMAEALFGLLLGEAHRRRLLGLSSAPTSEDARQHALTAVSMLQIGNDARE